MGVKITKIDFYLPERVLTNAELSSQFPDWSPEKIEEKIGVRERRIVAEEQTAFDLAIEACEKVLLNEDKDSIDFLILCTQSPDYYLPSTSCILQDRIGLRKNIGAFDFNLGCSGYIYGLGIAKGLVSAGIASKILFVTSETYSKFLNFEDKGNRTIFGDAATATIIEYTDKDQIFEFDLGTDGGGYDNLIVPNGGLRNRYNPNVLPINKDQPFTGNDLYMNGPEIFNFTLQRIPNLVRDVLIKNKITMDDIDYCVFHQANKYILNYLKKKLKIPDHKFYCDLLLTGNTVSSTIPLGLYNIIKSGVVTRGDKVLLVGFGVGLSWGATIIEI